MLIYALITFFCSFFCKSLFEKCIFAAFPIELAQSVVVPIFAAVLQGAAEGAPREHPARY